MKKNYLLFLIFFLATFTISAQNTPGGVSITNLTTWFDANNGPNVSVGNPTSWANRVTGQSINTLSRGATSGGVPPLLIDGDPNFNFNKVMAFNAGYYFGYNSTNLANTVVGANSGTLFAIINNPDFSINLFSPNTSGNSTGDAFTTGFTFFGANFGYVGFTNNATGRGANWNPAYSNPNRFAQMIASRNNNGSFTAYYNASTSVGTTTGRPTTTTTLPVTATSYSYYMGLGYYGNPTSGAVAEQRFSETMTFLNDIGAANLSYVMSYLALKYGITYGKNKTTPASARQDYNLITNTGTNTVLNLWKSTLITDPGYNYHNQIAGIVRVDNSALYQKQSHSVEDLNDMVTIGLNTIASSNNANTGTINDQNALVWGNNGVSLTNYNSFTFNSQCYQRLGRVWRMKRTGSTINTVNTQVKFNTYPSFGYLSANTDYFLNIDRNADGDFDDAIDEKIPVSSFNGSFAMFDNIKWDTDGSGYDNFTLLKRVSCGSVTILKDRLPDSDDTFDFTTTIGNNTLSDGTSNNIIAKDITFSPDGKLVLTTASGALYAMANGASEFTQPLAGNIATRVDGGTETDNWTILNPSGGSAVSTDAGTSYSVPTGTGVKDIAHLSGNKFFFLNNTGLIRYFDGTNAYTKNANSYTDIDYANTRLVVISNNGQVISTSTSIEPNVVQTGTLAALNTADGTIYNDIAIGYDGEPTSIYTINSSGNILNYSGTGIIWNTLPAPPSPATAITVDPNGLPWIVMTNGDIAAYTGTTWKRLKARLPGYKSNFVNYFHDLPSAYSATESAPVGNGYTTTLAHEGTGTPTINNGLRKVDLNLFIGNHAYETFTNSSCGATDNDSDGVYEICDLDDDNDGILDANETSCFTGSINLTTANANALSVLNGTNTQGAINNNFIKLTIAKASGVSTTPVIDNGHVIGSGFTGYAVNTNHSDAALPGVPQLVSTYDFKFPVANLKFKVLDLDDLDGVKIEAYDANNTLINLSPSMYSFSSTVATSVSYSGPNTFTSPLVNTSGQEGMVNLDYTGFEIKKLVISYTDGNTGGSYSVYDLNGTTCDKDTDGDGIADRLDTDSDGDGCPDAVEGAGNITTSQLTSGHINGAVSATGIPILVGAGQVVGTSLNATQKDTACYNLILTSDIFSVTSTSNITPNILVNDTLDAVAPVIGTNLGQVAVTQSGVWPAGITLNADGTLNVATSVPLGTYNVTYQVCVNGAVPALCQTTTVTINKKLDTDGDGISDDVDLDDDNDGIVDTAEGVGDADGDGISNSLDLDSDNDGILDIWESLFYVSNIDPDGDGRIGTGSTPADADGDGLADIMDPDTPTGAANTSNASYFGDRDGDGIKNQFDIDADNDGIVDNIEGQSTSGYKVPTGLDTDNDGIDNAYDVNSGGAGIGYVNTDGGSAPDYVDLDSDNDGFWDLQENQLGASSTPSSTTGYASANPVALNANEKDANADGLFDGPFTDTDGDGLLDAFDNVNGILTPNNVTNNQTPTGSMPNTQTVSTPERDWREALDSDGDGVPDITDIDDDNDGILDTVEGSGDKDNDGVPNYLDLDSDNDGIYDVIEAGGTDPDNDGFPGTTGSGPAYPPVGANGLPSSLGGTALTAGDFDGDGIANYLDLDSDNDGIYDVIEAGGTDSNNDGLVGPSGFVDADADGINDLVDSFDNIFHVAMSGTPLPVPNTDGTGGANFLDTDADGDGCFDAIEGAGNITAAQVDGSGFITGGVNATTGVPTATPTGQGLGYSTNTLATCLDTDNDGYPDGADLDDDNDGILDTVEIPCTSTQAQWSHNASGGQSDFVTFENDTTTTSPNFTSGANMIFGAGLDETTDNYSFTYLLRGATSIDFTSAKTANDYAQVSYTPSKKMIFNALNFGFYTNSATDPEYNCGNFKIAVEYSTNSSFTSPTLLFKDKQVGAMIAGGYLNLDNAINNILLQSGTTYYFRIYLYDEQNTDANNRVRLDDVFFNHCLFVDTDGDGISNDLDLDSDGDGCYDAIEGDENVAYTQLNANGSINTTANGGVNANGVPNIVNVSGAADVGGDEGQGIGNSQDNTKNDCSVSLSITKTDSKTRYQVNTTTVYTIVVKNDGAVNTVTNAVVNDNLPSGIAPTDFTYTAVASAGSTTNVTGTQTGAINDLVTLLPGGTVTYTVNVYVPPFFVGNLVNTATITAPSGALEADTTNNTSTDTDTPAINAFNDSFSNNAINTTIGGIAGDVTLNDELNNALVTDALIDITILDDGGISGATIDANGNLSIPSGVAPGLYTITYRICEKADPTNCDEAFVILQVHADTDGDGISDIIDLDDDNDGILDTVENSCSSTILFNEDFGTGNRTTTPYTNYIYQPLAWNTATNTGGGIDDGYYAIVNAVDATVAQWATCYWVNSLDHTPSDTNGRLALYNGTYNANEEFYKRTNIAVTPNSNLNLSLWALNIDLADNCDHANIRKLPKIRVIIKDNVGNIIGSFNTGAIPKNEIWNNYQYNFNSGSNTEIQFLIINDAEGGLGNDLAIDDIQIKTPCDFDNDGIPNNLDLDSDGDGCSDSIEGDENIENNHINANGSINIVANGGVNVNGVPNIVNNTGIADIGGDEGQGIGSSQDATVNACYCYKPGVTSGTLLDSNHGISAFGRAGDNNGNWPMQRKGAWTVLEAKTKGFVINRLTDAQISALPATGLVEGMVVYNITQDCLQINIDGTPTGWKCFNHQTCPN